MVVEDILSGMLVAMIPSQVGYDKANAEAGQTDSRGGTQNLPKGAFSPLGESSQQKAKSGRHHHVKTRRQTRHHHGVAPAPAPRPGDGDEGKPVIGQNSVDERETQSPAEDFPEGKHEGLL